MFGLILEFPLTLSLVLNFVGNILIVNEKFHYIHCAQLLNEGRIECNCVIIDLFIGISVCCKHLSLYLLASSITGVSTNERTVHGHSS